jgi:hypothetical protein
MNDCSYIPHRKLKAVTITNVANEETKATVIHAKGGKPASHILLLLLIAGVYDQTIRVKR